MAARTPVKVDGSGNIVAMSATDLSNIQAEVIRQYGLSPSVTVSAVVSGGNLGTLSDTRYQAGASSTNVSSFPAESITAEPTQVTVNYSRMSESVESLSSPIDTDLRAFPLYVDASNNLRAMSLTDFFDTFISGAIDTLTTADQTTSQAGTYTIHTANTLTGATLIDAGPVFTDTQADLTQYTAAGIPEALDQPITTTDYYLFRIDPASVGTIPIPMFVRSDGNIQSFTQAAFQTMLGDAIRYFATQTGSRIEYIVDTSATGARGSGMANTDHTGVTGLYQTRLINSNDYRAQEFPNGTPATITTNYLRCVRA